MERRTASRSPPCPTAQTSGISGTKPYVLDGAQADLVIVAARTDAGTSLFTVDAKERGRDGDRLFRRWTRPAAWPPSRSTTPRRSSSASRAAAGTY